jgi:hypothetical protein
MAFGEGVSGYATVVQRPEIDDGSAKDFCGSAVRVAEKRSGAVTSKLRGTHLNILGMEGKGKLRDPCLCLPYSAQLAASLQIGPSAIYRDCKGSSLPSPSTFKQISPYVLMIPFHDIVTLASCPSR